MKDFVFNLQRFTKTIRLTNSDDDYDNRSEDVKILALKGDDYVYNSGNYVTIISCKGDDTVNNQSDYTIVNCGVGNDYLITSSNNYSMTYHSTLSGGKGL